MIFLTAPHEGKSTLTYEQTVGNIQNLSKWVESYDLDVSTPEKEARFVASLDILRTMLEGAVVDSAEDVLRISRDTFRAVDDVLENDDTITLPPAPSTEPGAGDFFADGSVPMTGTLTVEDGDILIQQGMLSLQTKSITDFGIKLKGSVLAPDPTNPLTPAADPNTFSDLLTDLDFQDPAIQGLGNGASISAWGPASQGSASNQPTKQADGVLFDGVNDYITFPEQTAVKSIIWVGHYTADNNNWAPIFADDATNPFHGGGYGEGDLFEEGSTAGVLTEDDVIAFVNGVPTPVGDIDKPIGTPIILIINLDNTQPAIVEAIGSQGITSVGRFFNGTVKRAMLFGRRLTSNEIIAATKHFGNLYSIPYNVNSVPTIDPTFQQADFLEIRDGNDGILTRIKGDGSYDGLVEKLKKGDDRQYDADPTVLLEWQTSTIGQKWIGLVGNDTGLSEKYEVWMGLTDAGNVAEMGSYGQADLRIVARGGRIAAYEQGWNGPGSDQVRFGNLDGNGEWVVRNDGSWSIGDRAGNSSGRHISYGTNNGSDDANDIVYWGPLNLRGHPIKEASNINLSEYIKQGTWDAATLDPGLTTILVSNNDDNVREICLKNSTTEVAIYLGNQANDKRLMLGTVSAGGGIQFFTEGFTRTPFEIRSTGQLTAGFDVNAPGADHRHVDAPGLSIKRVTDQTVNTFEILDTDGVTPKLYIDKDYSLIIGTSPISYGFIGEHIAISSTSAETAFLARSEGQDQTVEMMMTAFGGPGGAPKGGYIGTSTNSPVFIFSNNVNIARFDTSGVKLGEGPDNPLSTVSGHNLTLSGDDTVDHFISVGNNTNRGSFYFENGAGPGLVSLLASGSAEMALATNVADDFTSGHYTVNVLADGSVWIGSPAYLSLDNTWSHDPGVVSLTVKGVVGQTANLLDIVDSTNTKMFSFEASGAAKIGDGNIDSAVAPGFLYRMQVMGADPYVGFGNTTGGQPEIGGIGGGASLFEVFSQDRPFNLTIVNTAYAPNYWHKALEADISGNVSIFARSGDTIGANENGRDINLSAGHASQDSGTGTPGKVIISAGITSDGGDRGEVFIDGHLNVVYPSTFNNGLTSSGIISDSVFTDVLQLDSGVSGWVRVSAPAQEAVPVNYQIMLPKDEPLDGQVLTVKEFDFAWKTEWKTPTGGATAIKYAEVQINAGGTVDLAASASRVLLYGGGAQTTNIRLPATTYDGLFYVFDNSTQFSVDIKLPNDNVQFTLAPGSLIMAMWSDEFGGFWDAMVFRDQAVSNVQPKWIQEVVTLTATDITNQYVNLSTTYGSQGGGGFFPGYKANSFNIRKKKSAATAVTHGDHGDQGFEYTIISVGGGPSGFARVVFANDWATGGPAALADGDVLVVRYAIY